MSPIPAYEADPYARELSVNVVASGSTDDGPFAIVDDSVLYPEGGGQPSDTGWLSGVPVTDVRRDAEGFRLELGRPVEAGPATLVLDWDRRYDHMQQHTAQHLITAVASDEFGWNTTSFHLGAELCDVELDVESVSPADRTTLETLVMQRVRAALPVVARRVSIAAYRDLQVRSRGLPSGHVGDVRLVEIQDVDVTTCGGTHLACTSEIGSVVLLSSESMRGGTRLYWVAGSRVRRRLGVADARAGELRRILGVADDEIVAAVQARGEQLKDSLKQIRRLEDAWAAAEAYRLTASQAPVVGRYLAGASPRVLQMVARNFGAAAGMRLALLSGDGTKGAHFVLAAGEDFPGDLQALGSHAATLLDGAGGGSGRTFQGRCPSLEGFDAALEDLRARIGRMELS